MKLVEFLAKQAAEAKLKSNTEKTSDHWGYKLNFQNTMDDLIEETGSEDLANQMVSKYLN